MNFDIRTILVAMSIVSLVSALIMMFAWHFARSMRVFIGYWSLSLLLMSIGVVLIACRGLLPDFVTIIIANTAIIAGQIASQEGIARFMGKPGYLRNATGVVLAAQILLFLFFTYGILSVAMRVVVYSLAAGAISVISVMTLRGRDEAMDGPARFFAMVQVFFIFLMIFRFSAAVLQGEYAQFLNSGPVQAVSLLGMLAYYSSLGLCYFWLVARRLSTELHKQKAAEIAAQTQLALERQQAADTLRKLNETLEQMVRERTAELELANKELEGFNYSVAHDLRTPLRHIVSFIEIVNEQAKHKLDEEHLQYLAIISQAAKESWRLLDDLMSFSQLGKAEMIPTRVETRLLVEEVIGSLQVDVQNRRLKWVLRDLPNVIGDNSMLRIVFQNLIGNAVKYTQFKEHAGIEIGTVPNQDETECATFFVKDNGVGFDMDYCDKLFSLFQRLHADSEFEGHGVGLANVQRIIARHGGKIWAEGRVNGGATFFFTLRKYTEPMLTA